MFCDWSRNDSLDEVVKLGKDQRTMSEVEFIPGSIRGSSTSAVKCRSARKNISIGGGSLWGPGKVVLRDLPGSTFCLLSLSLPDPSQGSNPDSVIC